jgi:hypothetical protein
VFLMASVVSGTRPVRALDDCAFAIQNCPQYPSYWNNYTFACYPNVDCYVISFCVLQECGEGFGMYCDDHGSLYGGAQGLILECPGA